MNETDPLAAIVDCLKRQDLAAAEVASRDVLSQHPHNPRAWHLSGIVHAQQSQLERALKCFQQAANLDKSNPLYHYNLGLACKSLNRMDEAIAAYREAIVHDHQSLEARNNLGNALMQQGENEEAIAVFQELVELHPGNAVSHFNLANLLQDTGNFDESLEHYRRTLELDPDHSAARENLGRAYTDAGLGTEAKQVWQAWLEREPNNAVAKHMVASTSGQTDLERCDDDYVRETFNQDFAKNFDSQLARLSYQAPQLVAAALEAVGLGSTQVNMLDAGCGTGLCGPLVRSMAKRLVGIDLSADMLTEARNREVYDDLIECEITQYLLSQPAAFDVIVCADTLCYFGGLEKVLSAARESLRGGGWFIFTVEESGEQSLLGYQLKQHGRFCHTEAYIQQAVAQAGFAIHEVTRSSLRKERGRSVAGLVVTAAVPPA